MKFKIVMEEDLEKEGYVDCDLCDNKSFCGMENRVHYVQCKDFITVADADNLELGCSEHDEKETCNTNKNGS